ncbi:hypothetical protein [Marinimicrobium sp. ABcell2]|uniref:hypothetical protein n=1 Tax=Marinimicrobium sp. ABcell2 TaxID=3069751 RepID=UPI0027B1D333|nr:hypothetical protein [Marinimicrobium sp. ABcell2]MDQ2078525.1 hypothetical protein [Marinimicrobium sp. ABcell2]
MTRSNCEKYYLGCVTCSELVNAAQKEVTEGMADAMPHKGKIALPEFVVCHKDCEPLVVIQEGDSRVGEFSKFEVVR